MQNIAPRMGCPFRREQPAAAEQTTPAASEQPASTSVSEQPVADQPQGQQKPKGPPSAAFLQSTSTPDGTVVKAGAEFIKIWRIINDGPIEWSDSTVLSYVYGDRLESPAAVQLPNAVAPGAEVEVAVTMVAPTDAGKYSNYWRLCASEGSFFGPLLWARITVEQQAEEPAPAPAPVPVAAQVVAEDPAAPPAPPAVVEVPSPAIPEVTAEEEAAIKELKSMGFSGDLVSALRRNDGNVERVIDELLQ